MKLSTLALFLIATSYAAAGWLPTYLPSMTAGAVGIQTPTPPCVSWQPATPYPTPIAEMAAATDGTYVYVFGGRSFQTNTGQVNRYDPVADTWTPLAPMPSGTYTRLIAEYGNNGKIYVMGGTLTAPTSTNNRIYDIATNTWSEGRQAFNDPASAHAFVNGWIYVTGGGSEPGFTNLTAYCIPCDIWNYNLAPMPQRRWGVASSSIGGKIYVAGGTSDGFNSHNSLYIYDIATNVWSPAASLPTAVKYASGVVFANEFWVLGGTTNTGPPLNIVQIYNPESNSWRMGPPMNSFREQAGAVKLNVAGSEKLVVVGGSSTFNSLLVNVESTTPECPPTPTPTPTITPTPVPTATPPFPTPTIPVSPIVRDGSLDGGFSLLPGVSGSGEVNAVASGTGGGIYVGGSFGSILGVATPNIARLFEDGVVDQSFNVGTGPNTIVRKIRVQSDGKVLVSGPFTTFNGVSRKSIVRLNIDGSVDPTFNITSDGSTLDVCEIQADGKVILCGNFTTINGVARKQIARVDASGNVDLSFDFGSGLPAGGFLYVVKVQPDGKILLGGSFSSVNGTNRSGMARLNSNGTVDPSFTLASGLVAADIQFSADNKIIITGDGGYRVLRLLFDGSLDPSFNSDNDFSTSVRFARPLPDGKILVAGDFTFIRVGAVFTPRRGIARLNSNGTVDTSFDSPLEGSVRVYSGQLDSSGRITLGGSFNSVAGNVVTSLARLNPNGSYDPSFVGTLVARSIVWASLVEPDGKILIGGGFDTLNTKTRKYVGRVHPDGSVDDSFIPDGSVDGTIQVVVRQPDGKYLVGGSLGSSANHALWRLNSDGSLDTSFSLPTFTSNSFVLAIALQPDGKILIGGGFSSINGIARPNLARLNPDGSLDSLSVEFQFSSRVQAIVILPDGKFVIGGDFGGVGGISNIGKIAKLNSDGSVDQQFSLNHGGSFAQIKSMANIGGSLYVGSNFSVTGVNDSRFPVVKLGYDGRVDLSFNAGRLVGDVYSIVPATFGKLIVGGTFNTFAESGTRRSLARLLPNGGLDFTFDSGAIVHPNGPVSEAVFTITPFPNDKILIGGNFSGIGVTTRWSVARLNVNQNVTRAISDFDGDAKSDLAVFRPTNSAWYWLKSYGGSVRALVWGLSTDKLVPADYDGDGIVDLAVFRPSEGRWYVLQSSNATFVASGWGVATDTPAPGDFDRDGRADHAIFRPADGTWWINGTSIGPYSVQFGQNGDQPIVSDYDADGRADIAVFRQSGGQAEWWVNRSTAGVLAMQFGSSTDKPVQADYTGDGKADIAIWRPSSGEWYIVRSEDFSFYAFPFGANGDVPAPGDYDGDGKADPTVFRPTSGTWFVGRTTAGTQIAQFGADGDRPVASVFIP